MSNDLTQQEIVWMLLVMENLISFKDNTLSISTKNNKFPQPVNYTVKNLQHFSTRNGLKFVVIGEAASAIDFSVFPNLFMPCPRVT